MRQQIKSSALQLFIATATCLLCLFALVGSAFAAKNVESTIGDSTVTWMFDVDTGSLYIGGCGETPVFTSKDDQPWADFREDITGVWFMSMGDITIPDMAYWFDGCTNMTQAEISYTTSHIGTRAFADCHNLTTLVFYYMDTETFTIAEDAFYSDTNVSTTVWCMTDEHNTSYVLYTYNWSSNNREIQIRDIYTTIQLGDYWENCEIAGCSCNACAWYYVYYSNGDGTHTGYMTCTGCGAEGAAGDYGSCLGNPCTYCGYHPDGGDANDCPHSSTSIEYDSNCYWYIICSTCLETLESGGPSHGPYTYQQYDESSHYCYCTSCETNIELSEHSDSNGDGACDDCGYIMTITYYVSYDANGGSGSMSNSTHTYGTESALDANTFTRIGYTFIGWSADEDATSATYTDGQSVIDLADTNGDTVTLYAIWRVDNTVSITSQPKDQTVVYGVDATFDVSATGPVPSGPEWELSYQWQFSEDNNTWSDISGAKSSTYTFVGGALDAGTYYYRVIVTCTIPAYEGVFDNDAKENITSSVATLTIKKAPGILNINDATDTAEMPSGGYYICKIGTSEIAIANATCNNGSTIEVGIDGYWTAAEIGEHARIKVRFEDGQLFIRPVSESLDGATVTLRTTASKNYEVTEWEVEVYASAGAQFSNKVLDPGTTTNTDVVASVTIIDPIASVDSNYKIVDVKAYKLENDGSETEISITKSGLDRYSFTVKENGNYELRATDTLGNLTRYGTDHNELYIDFIDKVAPEIKNIGGITFDSASALINVLLLAEDPNPGTPHSQLMYCWDYAEGSSENVWTAVNTNSFPPQAELVVAVKDLAGNITSVEYTVDLLVFDNNSGGNGGNIYAGVLSKIYNDISGTIFGKTSYLKNGTINNYSSGVYTFVFKVTPSTTKNYIGGHMVLDYGISGQKDITFPVTWYENEACTVPIGTVSDDGSLKLVNDVAYGKVVLDSMEITNIRTSARNAFAILYLTQYEDKSTDGKVHSEKYSMPCSVDVTAPSISASYDPYRQEITLKVQDSISGITEDVSYTITNGSSGTCAPYAVLNDPNNNATFTIAFTATDVLDNESSRSFTFTPADIENNDGSGDDGPDDNIDINIYGYKSKMFNVYIINGIKNNSATFSVSSLNLGR